MVRVELWQSEECIRHILEFVFLTSSLSGPLAFHLRTRYAPPLSSTNQNEIQDWVKRWVGQGGLHCGAASLGSPSNYRSLRLFRMLRLYFWYNCAVLDTRTFRIARTTIAKQCVLRTRFRRNARDHCQLSRLSFEAWWREAGASTTPALGGKGLRGVLTIFPDRHRLFA